MAKLARRILDAKKKVHELLGRVAEGFLARLRAEPIERIFARKLVENIPLPFVDAKGVATARALQLVGIYLCLVNDKLDKCECLADLARSEAKDRLKALITAASDDWINLSKIEFKGKEPGKDEGPGEGSNLWPPPRS
jgi:hypothetical protein